MKLEMELAYVKTIHCKAKPRLKQGVLFSLYAYIHIIDEAFTATFAPTICGMNKLYCIN